MVFLASTIQCWADGAAKQEMGEGLELDSRAWAHLFGIGLKFEEATGCFVWGWPVSKGTGQSQVQPNQVKPAARNDRIDLSEADTQRKPINWYKEIQPSMKARSHWRVR